MHVIDSHTEGEPTRVILSGGPDLGSGSLAEQAARLASNHQDFYRRVVSEPYGQEAMVGALLVAPTQPDCVAGVIYFDAAAVLGMCGHGTIGVVATLAHLGRIGVGTHKLETPVGIVEVTLIDANTVSVVNVSSYRQHQGLCIEVAGIGPIYGDVAWGGNWFFMVNQSPVAVAPGNLRALTETTLAIREALRAQPISGLDDTPVDHIVLYGPPLSAKGHSRNFVLCPDDTYDRSPCGTASSARLACLAADGLLAPATEIYQESIIGSGYYLAYQTGENGAVIPTITGQAFITREATLQDNPTDPLRLGIQLTGPV